MMNTNNSYFEEMKRIGYAWEEAQVERKNRKQQIIDTLGWDSEELKAWYEEDKAAVFPFPQGASKAYRAWAGSISRSASASGQWVSRAISCARSISGGKRAG